MFSHNVNSINSSRLEGIGSPYGVVFCCRVDVEADKITQRSGDVEMLVMLFFFCFVGPECRLLCLNHDFLYVWFNASVLERGVHAIHCGKG